MLTVPTMLVGDDSSNVQPRRSRFDPGGLMPAASGRASTMALALPELCCRAMSMYSFSPSIQGRKFSMARRSPRNWWRALPVLAGSPYPARSSRAATLRQTRQIGPAGPVPCSSVIFGQGA